MEMSSSTQAGESSSSDIVSRARKLLFRRMLVGIKDGRFFLGSFHCIDKQGNIILQDAVEYRNTHRSSPSPMEQRCLGVTLLLRHQNDQVQTFLNGKICFNIHRDMACSIIAFENNIHS
ncbi:SMALL NUCLEAR RIBONUCLEOPROTEIN-ASSOCIATED PROTEIN B AND N [Salix viminalis]|uniref:SMALL NUCLEAR RIBONUCLEOPROTEIN-ASSOCIATED PROTEIN B AND N n=1 Tax=Salix viminalis TaxID=40686 RepID=A0A9Q0NUD7_SALVM|nr:SMALL NUCLEAR RIBONUCLEOPROTEIN-ASSOCIATED PROTEIN B AND N [Salix viminalis]